MIDSVLSSAIRPGAYSSWLGGRHLGVIPMVIAGIFVVLLIGGIFWGAMSRLENATDNEQSEALSGTTARPTTSFGDLFENDHPQPEPVPEPEPVAERQPVPPVDGALKAQREYRQQQRMRELQNRALGKESSIIIATTTLRDDPAPNGREEPVPVSPAGAPPGNPTAPNAARLAELVAGARADTPSAHDQRLAFLKEPAQKAWLPHIRQPDLSRYTLKTGAVIPGILVTGMNSDLPGHVIAQVSQNVYDTATGQHLLIPQGSKLYGTYDSRVSYGQNRALVAWDRIIFPDASTLELGRMQGSDGSGYSGFKDQVNNHYLKLFGQTLLLSAIQTLPAQISGTSQTAGDDEFARITATNTSKLGEKLIDRNLSIQPTIRIRPGYPFTIVVNRDILFTGAYRG